MSFEPAENYFFIFSIEPEKTDDKRKFWVIPSKEVIKLGHQNKSGKNIGKVSIRLPKSEKSSNYKKFKKFENAFHLLEEYK